MKTTDAIIDQIRRDAEREAAALAACRIKNNRLVDENFVREICTHAEAIRHKFQDAPAETVVEYLAREVIAAGDAAQRRAEEKLLLLLAEK